MSDRRLPALALDAIAHALTRGTRRLPAPSELPDDLATPGATFVTLERDGDLLGCVGSLEARRPLGVDTAHNALAAAFDDPRVPPLTADDYAAMRVKVAVLSPMQPLHVDSCASLVEQLRPGVDGVVVEAGRRRATFLPAVWPKVRDADEFVALLWRKAGLVPDVWPRGTRVFTYTTVEHHDDGPRPGLC